eukprot:TRINITY_DN11630_c0_g2_i1.p1 TRINITY_DN11630_c0_g2~~TRINITY_DN11630_c0_g2_i1.p1  ORF type:complete len:494 (+),score=163.77 TRINITY_DN11630_c0_g2_i1:199-1680(+)
MEAFQDWTNTELVLRFGMKPHRPILSVVESFTQLQSRPGSRLENELERKSNECSERVEELEEALEISRGGNEELARVVEDLRRELAQEVRERARMQEQVEAHERVKEDITDEVIEELVHTKENIKLQLEREAQSGFLTRWVFECHKRREAQRAENHSELITQMEHELLRARAALDSAESTHEASCAELANEMDMLVKQHDGTVGALQEEITVQHRKLDRYESEAGSQRSELVEQIEELQRQYDRDVLSLTTQLAQKADESKQMLAATGGGEDGSQVDAIRAELNQSLAEGKSVLEQNDRLVQAVEAGQAMLLEQTELKQHEIDSLQHKLDSLQTQNSGLRTELSSVLEGSKAGSEAQSLVPYKRAVKQLRATSLHQKEVITRLTQRERELVAQVGSLKAAAASLESKPPGVQYGSSAATFSHVNMEATNNTSRPSFANNGWTGGLDRTRGSAMPSNNVHQAWSSKQSHNGNNSFMRDLQQFQQSVSSWKSTVR